MVEGSLFRWEPLYKVTPLLWWQSVSSNWSMVGQRASPLVSIWNNSEGPAIRVLELPKGLSCTTAQRLPLPSPASLTPSAALESLFNKSPTPNLHLRVCFLGNQIQKDTSPTPALLGAQF